MTHPPKLVISNELNLAVRSFIQALIHLHSALLEATKLKYETEHKTEIGRAALLQLALNDPSFAWLRDLSGAIIKVDDLIDPKSKTTDISEFEQTLHEVHHMLWSESHTFSLRFQEMQADDALVILENKQVQNAWRHIAMSLRS